MLSQKWMYKASKASKLVPLDSMGDVPRTDALWNKLA